MLKDLGIKTISHLLAFQSEIKGLGKKKHESLLEQARSALPINMPKYLYVDYRKKANPYQARYGDCWSAVIKKTSAMSSYVVITDMVEHIIKESANLMQGTKHENDWVFYHDALSLMKAKDCLKWMREREF